MFKVSLPTAALVVFLSFTLCSSVFAQVYTPPPSPPPSGGTTTPPPSPPPSGGTTAPAPAPAPSGGSTTPAPSPTPSGGTTTPAPSTTPTPTSTQPSTAAIPEYTPPQGGYGRGKTIAYVVAPFAIVAVTYLIVRHNRKAQERAQASAVISGCIERSTAGLRVMNEKDGNFYSLISDGAAVMPGERMGLKGKKQKDSSGKLSFVVEQVTNDYGTCAASASR